jgi:hypothetical protein
MDAVAPFPASAATASAHAAPPQEKTQPHFSFDDFLDVINPLQHLPVVGTLYRKITGDKMGTPEKLIGDTLYGGPMGLASSLVETGFETITGKDFGDTVLGWLGFGDENSQTDIAAAAPQDTNQLWTGAPTITTAEASPPQSEASITASLNRAQYDRAIAARTAYAKATASPSPPMGESRRA